MTDDERMGVFRRKVAELYGAIGMDNTPRSTNMLIAEIIGASLLEVFRVERAERFRYGGLDLLGETESR